MSTGLLIRDFVKEYRELRYQNSGSITLSEIEHNAYRNALTLEVTHTDGQRYENLKTLPENSHYGYVTLFRGSTVASAIPVKYTKFRVFDINNDGLWQYHQHLENMQLLAGQMRLLGEKTALSVIEEVAGSPPSIPCFLIKTILSAEGEDALKWLLSVVGCGDSGPTGSSDLEDRYRAYPIATPFPDIAKFKSDLPVSFLWRLESWYLVNPAVYIVDNPTDTGDETEGEDEYPEPESGDGDGDGDEFPETSPVDPNADPKDFNGGDVITPTGGATQIRVQWKAYGDPQSSTNTGQQPEIVVIRPGYFTASDISTGCDQTATTGPAGTFCVRPKLLLKGEEIWSAFVSVPNDWVTSKQAIYFQNG